MNRVWRYALLAALAVAGVAALAGSAATPPGLDRVYGTAGAGIVHRTGWYLPAGGGAAQSHGEAVVVGGGRAIGSPVADNDLFVTRLTSDGAVDTSFGTDGITFVDVGGGHRSDWAQTAIVLPDDRILVAAYARVDDSTVNAVLARFTADGTIDTSFATNGFYAVGLYRNEGMTAIGVQGEKLVAVVGDYGGDRLGFSVLRLNADGTLDPTFGTLGVASVGRQGAVGYSLVVRPDGRLVVGGSYGGRMAAWGFNASGLADLDFGDDGLALGAPPLAAGTFDTSYGIVEQPDGKIVLAGGRGFTANGAKSNGAFALERLTALGDLDASFGKQGVATLQLAAHDDEIEWLLQAPDGKLAAVGVAGIAETASSWRTQIAAARFTADGVADATFGAKGGLITTLGSTSSANGGAMLGDGRFYAIGYTVADGDVAAVAVRYLGTPPAIVMPSGGGLAGEHVELQGAGFTTGTTVAVGSVVAPDVLVASPSSLSFVVPDDAVTGKLVVGNVNGTATSKAVFGVRPTIGDLDSTDPVPPGGMLGINGNTFVGVTSVKIGGVAWKTSAVTARHLTVTAPAAAVSGVLAITNAGGTTTAGSVTVRPTITKFAPLSAAAGSVVTVTGSGLAGTTVTFAGQPATVSSSSALQLRVEVPSTAAVGPIAVQPLTGDPARSALDFKPLPRLSRVAGGSPGDTVVLTGTNLADATAVKLGAVAAEFVQVDALQLTAVVPSGVTSGKWTVTTPAGTASSAAYTVGPTITGIDPQTGVAGTVVSVHGAAFTAVKEVSFGGGVKAKFTLKNAGLIVATVPAGAHDGPVGVRTAYGSAQSPVDFLLGPP